MAHPSSPIIESNQEVFRAPIYALDQPTSQSRSESRGERETEVGSAQFDIFYALTVEMAFKTSSDSLDLGQLGHGPLNPLDSMILTTP